MNNLVTSPKITPVGYNKGDIYEDKIFLICVSRGITNPEFKRGGAGNLTDIVFIHNGQLHNLEVKANTGADYGQKMLKWSNNTWSWCVDDEVTKMYTQLGVLKKVQDKNIVPRRYTMPQELLTENDRLEDQHAFEMKMEIDTIRLFLFYGQKNCHYMQIGGYGFYYLDEDVLNLGVPQFNGKLKIRFRAKTIHSLPIWKYGFYAVLKITEPPTPSPFDLDTSTGRLFPPIKP